MAIDLEKLQESPNLLDILLQMEDVLDQMDVYVFDNWLKGEVIEGPVVRRYWLDMTLRYDFKDMPDPRAALRLLKHGVRVDYEKARYSDEDPKTDPEAIPEDDEKKYDEEEMCWLLRVSIPRRLVVQIDAAQHDFYDEEIDIDDVEDAKDSGIDDESAYTDGEQAAPGGDPMAPPGGPGGPPPGGPPPGGPGGAPPRGPGGGF